MKTLIIDVPNYMNDDNDRFLVQEKVFEFVANRPTKYLSEYEILFNCHSEGSIYIEKLIKDWNLKYRKFASPIIIPTNTDKLNVIRDVVEEGKNGDALIFSDYNIKDQDISNDIMIDYCRREFGIYMKVCRLDYGNKLF